MDRISLIIAEDERLTRDALARLLDLEDDIQVVGQAADGESALRLVREKMPDVLLTDTGMPKMNGIELTQRVKKDFPSVHICVLTICHDDSNVFQALKAGALSDRACSDGVQPHQRPAHMNLFSELTPREIEVLKEVATGKRNREIAETLFVSEKTIKSHIFAILGKLNANDRTEAAMMAACGGLIEP